LRSQDANKQAISGHADKRDAETVKGLTLEVILGP